MGRRLAPDDGGPRPESDFQPSPDYGVSGSFVHAKSHQLTILQPIYLRPRQINSRAERRLEMAIKIK